MKKIFYSCILFIASYSVQAQGCSDAGFCTAGNFAALYPADSVQTKKPMYKNEMDVTFIYGTHNKNTELFYQPQLNYRHIRSNGSFFEIRFPLNIVHHTTSGITTTGIGDITATYNDKFSLTEKHRIDYTVGLRVSLSNADKSKTGSIISYPMFLQSGLGTTDVIAVLNYDIIKYLSIGTGIQLPVIQYNSHKIVIGNLYGDGFRRKPDALLKLSGHYQTKKIKLNAGLLSIFHLANDHYNSPTAGKHFLENSKGTTINWTTDVTYAFSRKFVFNLMYAEPLKTRKNIPDGLARSRIIVPKITLAF